MGTPSGQRQSEAYNKVIEVQSARADVRLHVSRARCLCSLRFLVYVCLCVLQVATIKFAMLDQMKNPPMWAKDIVRSHFCLVRDTRVHCAGAERRRSISARRVD